MNDTENYMMHHLPPPTNWFGQNNVNIIVLIYNIILPSNQQISTGAVGVGMTVLFHEMSQNF